MRARCCAGRVSGAALEQASREAGKGCKRIFCKARHIIGSQEERKGSGSNFQKESSIPFLAIVVCSIRRFAAHSKAPKLHERLQLSSSSLHSFATTTLHPFCIWFADFISFLLLQSLPSLVLISSAPPSTNHPTRAPKQGRGQTRLVSHR